MKILFAIIFCLIAAPLFASPYIVCDPQSGVTHYKITGWSVVTKAAEVDGSVKLDVATASSGTTKMTFSACISDSVWGEVCSDTVPFDLVKPTKPVAPQKVRLAP